MTYHYKVVICPEPNCVIPECFYRESIVTTGFLQKTCYPQIESPIGDFFGAAPGVNPYITFPVQILPDGTMICRFVMPYKKSVEVSVENMGNQDAEINLELEMSNYRWKPDVSMYFYAHWRVNHNLSGAPGTDVADLPFLLASGSGVYVGTAIMLIINFSSPGGTFFFVMTTILSPKSGRFQIRLDDVPIKQRGLDGPVDLFSPYKTMSRNYFFQSVILSKRDYTLTIEALSKNKKSGGSTIGVDFFWLLPKIE